MRNVLVCLACLIVVLTGCQNQPAAGVAPAAPAATSTEEMTSTEGMTSTEQMASMEGMTSTEEMTAIEKMAAAEISVPFEAIQLILELAPGAQTPIHSHGGPDLITVLDGEVTLHLDATGEETVYGPGEYWTETPGMLHVASNAGQETAHMAAAFLLPEGASLTTVKEGASSADMPPGPKVLSRTSMSVTESLGNFEVIQLILELAPGAQTPPHSHGGPDLITVLDGEATLHLDATGEETVYSAGEYWTETPEMIHIASNAGQETARMAALFLLPEGASLTTVKEGASTADMPPGPKVVSRTTMSVTTTEGMTSTGMTDEEKIANAMTAGPPFITANAAVLDWPSEEGAQPVELRAGSNGWLCRPSDPITPANDPRCFDANWQQINGKAFGAEREAHNALGVAYMLQGGNAANNDDPSVVTPAAGEEWQTDPPHVMVNTPIEWDLSVYAHEHNTGVPWVMFGGSPVEHMMFPVEMVPVESEAGDDKIANALSAGPTWIREGAGVIDWPTAAGAKVSELRPSTNGWTCIPDNPGSPTNDPMCLDAQWVTWLNAYIAGEEPEKTAVGFAYMLQGGSDTNNADPSLSEPPAGSEWVISPPHVMILSPEPLDLSMYSSDHLKGGPWVMFGGTPYEHIMMPLTDPVAHHGQ